MSEKKGLKVYRLEIPGGEDNVDESEHFSALGKAKRRRSEIIKAGHAERGTLAIERLELVALPLRALVLKVLNQKGYVAERIEVVPAWDPEPEVESADSP